MRISERRTKILGMASSGPHTFFVLLQLELQHLELLRRVGLGDVDDVDQAEAPLHVTQKGDAKALLEAPTQFNHQLYIF